MSEPYIGEVRIFAFDFAPRGWAACNGQVLPIGQNQALFALLGTVYGGNGQTTFALPDLRGRTPLHFGQAQGASNYALGQGAGEEGHTLLSTEIPPHTHQVNASNAAATAQSPANAVWAQPAGLSVFSNAGGGAMSGAALANGGNSQPHPNLQPYLTVNFCIALQGTFPSRN